MNRDTITVIATGDIFLGEHPVTLNIGVNSTVKKYGADYLFSRVKEQLKGADLVCANLEGIISPKLSSDEGVRSAIFWGEPACARALKDAGFNCLFLANNHTAQHGKQALIRTCRLLDENNIAWSGFNSEIPDDSKPSTMEVRGIKVTLLAYCQTQQYHLDTPILPLARMDNIRRDIQRFSGESDIVIVSLHWGDEFIDYPSPRQMKMARDIIDSGARLILGHHSHIVQGIERYNNGLIAYSLGSFVKDLWPARLRESVILKCEIPKSGNPSFELVPIVINDNWQPELYYGRDADQYRDKLQRLSAQLERYEQKDFMQLQARYDREVRWLLYRDRLSTIAHYMKNIGRYDLRQFLQNVILMTERRIYKKNI